MSVNEFSHTLFSRERRALRSEEMLRAMIKRGVELRQQQSSLDNVYGPEHIRLLFQEQINIEKVIDIEVEKSKIRRELSEINKYLSDYENCVNKLEGDKK